jgi:hypothetical protein
MLSRTIGASKKLYLIHTKNPDIAEFVATLYTWAIPHHDDLGQLYRDPFDWKHRIYQISQRPLEDFEKAIKLMLSVGLLQESVCGKAVKFQNCNIFQTLKNDRNPQNDFPGIKWKPLESNGALREVKGSEEEVKRKEGKLNKDKEKKEDCHPVDKAGDNLITDESIKSKALALKKISGRIKWIFKQKNYVFTSSPEDQTNLLKIINKQTLLKLTNEQVLNLLDDFYLYWFKNDDKKTGEPLYLKITSKLHMVNLLLKHYERQKAYYDKQGKKGED